MRFEASYIASKDDENTPPCVLGIVTMEHDDGSPEEAEASVRKVMEDMEKKFDQAVGQFTGASNDNHVLPQRARDILIGRVPEGIAAVFGLGDDEVGKTAVVLFDNKADLLEWRVEPVIGKHGLNEYNYTVPIDGGDQGQYTLFFMIDLFDRTKKVRPRLPS